MATEPTTIHATSGSELARLIDAAGEMPVLLEKDGVRYRLSREDDDVRANYDLEAVRAAIRAAAGTLSIEDGEELKRYIYRAREEGSRPADWPFKVLREAGLAPGDRVTVHVTGPGRLEIVRTAGHIMQFGGTMPSGVYPDGYLYDLREEWER